MTGEVTGKDWILSTNWVSWKRRQINPRTVLCWSVRALVHTCKWKGGQKCSPFVTGESLSLHYLSPFILPGTRWDGLAIPLLTPAPFPSAPVGQGCTWWPQRSWGPCRHHNLWVVQPPAAGRRQELSALGGSDWPTGGSLKCHTPLLPLQETKSNS